MQYMFQQQQQIGRSKSPSSALVNGQPSLFQSTNKQQSFPFSMQPSVQTSFSPSQTPLQQPVASNSSPRHSPRQVSSQPPAPPLLPCSKDFSFRYRDFPTIGQFICCVCLDVLADDCVQHAVCNTLFCRKCVCSTSVCPMCRTFFDPNAPSPQVLESLHQLPVFCPVPGCNDTQVITRGSLNVHILSSHLCEVLVSLQHQVDYLNAELRTTRAEQRQQRISSAGKRSKLSPSPTLSPSSIMPPVSPNATYADSTVAYQSGLTICGRCRRVYTEEEKQSCWFHSGAFASQVGWTCCGSQDYYALGCKSVPHIPVVEYHAPSGAFC